MSEFERNMPVKTEFLFELHMRVLLQERRRLYCLVVVLVGFPVALILTC